MSKVSVVETLEKKHLDEYTFDEICESQDFEHHELFVLKEDYDKVFAALRHLAERVEEHIKACQLAPEDGIRPMATHSILSAAIRQADRELTYLKVEY